MVSFDNKVLLGLGSAAIAFAMPAYAQDSVVDESSSQEDVIIVTAQNRAEDVQDVPIAINVIGAEELANAGFNDANDLGKIAPAVQINQDQGSVKITVRGVGTTSNDEAQDTSVVANIDGEYINRPNVLSVALFDLERVEVLRGPQGTLYGRNSTGGAINFITKKPDGTFAADASASYGNYNDVQVNAGVSVPLAGDVGVRVAGFYKDRDGYVDHPAGGGFFVFPAFDAGTSDDNKAYGGRVSLGGDVGALSFNVAAEYADRKFRPQIFAAQDLSSVGPTGPGCNATGFERVAPAYPQTLCVPASTNFLSKIDRGEYAAPQFGLGSPLHQKTWAVRGRLSYEFSPAATLSYIAGYRDFSQGDVDGNEFLTLPIIYRSYYFADDAQTQSHELRLNGEVGNGIIYQIGGFYFDEKLYREAGFALPSFIFGQAPDSPATFLSYFGRDVESKSLSGFGQVEVPLGDTLTAVAGLRYTDNSRDGIYTNAGPFGQFGPDPALVAAGTGRKDFADLAYVTVLTPSSSESKLTWLAGLNYQPTPDTLVYGKVSTGFKGGGFDSVGTYAPETNTAYELGWKQNWGGYGQNTFNLTGFYYDYRDLQVTVLLDTTIGNQVFNAGKAKIYGLEAESSIEMDDNDSISISMNYLYAKYDELFANFNVFTVPGTGTDLNGIGDLDPTQDGVQQPNFAGNSAPFSPAFIGTFGYNHTFDLRGAGTIDAGFFTTFKSSYFTDFYNYRDGKQDHFSQTDLTVEWKSANEMFSVLGYVRNLEDVRPLTYGSFTSAGPDDIYNWQFGTPRTYGVRVSVKY